MVKAKDATASELSALSLETLGHGAVAELFEVELERVLENILDPNTPAEKKREITLKFTIAPNKDRNQGKVGVAAGSKLAACHGASSEIYFGRKNGKVTGVTYDPRQMQLQWDKPEEVRAGTGTEG